MNINIKVRVMKKRLDVKKFGYGMKLVDDVIRLNIEFIMVLLKYLEIIFVWYFNDLFMGSWVMKDV